MLGWRLGTRGLRGPRRFMGCCACALTLAMGAPFGCSATGDDSSFEPSSGSGGSGSGASGAGGSGGVDITGGGGPGSGGSGNTGPGCSEEAKLVYVVGQGNELYSFDPPTLTFTQVGIIACPQNGGFATPFSMAVARNGTAYVLFSDGKLYNVDTTNAACTATTFQPGQAGLLTFGMGFVSDAPGSEAETLFVGDYNGTGIGKIDVATMQLTFVGPYDELTGPAEMTGTGDARLYGFFLSTPVNVAEIDKTSGAILSQAPQPTVTIGSAWAFAFWGGDFWLFTDPAGFSSQVDRYQPSTGMTTTVKQNVGISIVGAGVSTCAPVEPPK